MRISQAFPSRYVSAADLNGSPVKLKMGIVDMVDVGEVGSPEMKPCLYFVGAQKGLVLNKTNGNAIAEQFGDDTDMWAGQEITLIPTQTEFGGKIVPCIRIQLPGAMAPQTAAPAPLVGAVEPAVLDDDIPF